MLMWWRFFFLALLCVFVGSAVPGASAQAPVLLDHPTNRVSFIGGSVLLSVTATGAVPLSYRWVKDGAPLARGTNRLLSMINLSPADAGGYQAVVSNSFGMATSRVASLTLTGAPPVIYLPPSNSVVCATTGARLSAGVSGSPPLRYQWYYEGSPVVGATSWTHTVQATMSGDHFVVVQNDFGTATSAVAQVTVGPMILVQPASQTVRADQIAGFAVVVTECPDTRFQWRWNGLAITNATNSTLRLGGLNGESTGDIDVVAWDHFGAVTSVVARLTVNEVPSSITEEPGDLIEPLDRPFASPWEGFLFRVGVSGAPKPVAQWYFNNVALAGQTNFMLHIEPTPLAQGFYHVALSNRTGSVTSRYAEFRMLELPPEIRAGGQPVSSSVCVDQGPTVPIPLYVDLQRYGWPPNLFQWFKDGEPIPDATNNSYQVTPVVGSFGGYVVVVTNAFGAVTSEVATVTGAPVFVRPPPAVNEVDAGSYTSLYTALSLGCNTVTFQWQRDGVDIPGATSQELYLRFVSTNDSGGYRLVVRWNSGSITSAVSRVEVVMREPYISHINPGDQEVFAEEWVGFYAGDYDPGAPAGTFQWLQDGRPIPGATNEYLEFFADSYRRQGRYALVISNELGSVTSPVATLKIFLFVPLILFEPEDTSTPSGEYASLSVYAEGAPSPAYQWLRNGVPIRGETNDAIELLARGTNDLAGYSVIASNEVGWVTSRVATVHVELFPPGFVRPLEDRRAWAGQRVLFSAGVTSAPPASYQWYFEGAPLAGETGETLQFFAGFLRQAGGYSVVASNPFGSVTSRVARLDIDLIAPNITINPASQDLVEGEVLSLRVLVNVPVEVKWQRDGIDVDGATNLVLRLRMNGPDDGGEYQAMVSNEQGAATSSVAQVTVRAAGPLDRWNWRSPKPQGNDLFDVAFGAGRFVAVGAQGATLISSNGVDWVDGRRNGFAERGTAIAHGNGVFVACEGGALGVSLDGADWQPIDLGLGIERNAYGVAFGNGRFVARLTDASVMISTNGFDWRIVTVAGLAFASDEIFYVNGRFVIPVYADITGGSDYGFAWSTDGADWEIESFPMFDFVEFLACGDGLCVGFSRYSSDWILLSSNGVDWTEQFLETPVTGVLRSVAYGNGRFVVAGYPNLAGSGLAVSSNGLEWIPIPGIGTNEFERVRFENGRFIAVGNRGVLATSTNGLDWLAVSWGLELNFRGIARANGLFVAVGNGGAIFSSVDGRVWTERESGVTNNFRGVTWFRDRFVVVGESGDQGVTSVALTSVDGIAWEAHQALGDLFSVSHNGRLLVAVGDQGTIVTSPDGAAWSKLPVFVNPQTGEGSPTTRDLNAITWTGTRFVAVGKDGAVLTSTNGLSWTSSGPGGRKNLHGIAYGDGIYVTVANDGVYYVSADASTWRAGNWPSGDLSDVVYGGGRFMAVGDSGVMFTSGDGTNWIRRVTGCGNDLRSVLYSEGSYYAVGNNETILQSAQVDAALHLGRSTAAGAIRVEILAEPGRAYRLQGSANLTAWSDLMNFIAGEDATSFEDSLPAGQGWRFYRAISP